MKTRVITGIFLTALYVALYFAAETIVFPIFWTVACLIGLYEMFKCIGVLYKPFLTVPFYLLGAVMPITIFLCEDVHNWELGFFIAIFFIMFLCFMTALFSKGEVPLDQMAISFTSGIYIVIGFSLMQATVEFPFGKYLWLIGLLGTVMTDVFAYMCGRFLGRHKLIPDVSPKKTVEGSIGGALFGMLFIVLISLLIRAIDNSVEIHYLRLGICAFLIVIASQIGDLLMSFIKRHYGIKDYGIIFPGHGGMLDRFDSHLAVALLLFGYNQMWPIFTEIIP